MTDYNLIGFNQAEPQLRAAMSVVLQFSAEEEAKAIPILLRHSPGTLLPNRTYIVDEAVMPVLRDAQITFREMTPPSRMSLLEEATIGERI